MSEATATPDLATLVSANLDELIVGRALRHPIYNPYGMLLLAEGMVLTQDFVQSLKQKCVSSIRLHTDDASHMIFRPEGDSTGAKVQLDDAITHKIDEIIDSGFLFVVRSEPAVLEQMANHGCKGYNRDKHIERIEQNRESSVFVDNLMRNALQGRSVDAGQVTRLTADFFKGLTGDIDSSLASAVDTVRENPISDHCVAMALLGMALGIEMGFDAPNVRMLGLAALIHDWGMARIPKEIREAPRRLTETEYFEIAKHPIYTVRLLEKMCGIPPLVSLVAYQVHERPNGDGYPQGRAGDRTHVMAKILHVADIYSALISPRPYRPPLTPYSAMECLLRQAAAGEVDGAVVRALLMLQSLFAIGSYVVLSDGSVARVLRRNGAKYAQPIVQLVQDSDGKNVPDASEHSVIDLSAAGLNVVRVFPNPGSKNIALTPEIMHMGWQSPVANSSYSMEDSRGASSCAAALVNSNQPRLMVSDGLVSLESYTEKEHRAAASALDVLEGAFKLAEQQYGHLRKEKRATLRTTITVCLPSLNNTVLDVNTGNSIQVLASDISHQGLSFIHPGPVQKENVLIGLPAPNSGKTWLVAKIVRIREIQDTGFWQHAVAFRHRMSANGNT